MSRRNTGPTPAVVDLVVERAGNACEMCGRTLGRIRGVDWSVQHRVPRGMGGSRAHWINSAVNLLAVCGSGTTGCHGLIESRRADAVVNGWLIQHRAHPSAVAVLIERGSRWVYLTSDGRYADAPVGGRVDATVGPAVPS